MKLNNRLKKIGDVSKELKIPIHVIRFWEKKISVLKPIKKPNGTRYFSSDQLSLIKKIKFLLYEKRYSIEGVNLILNNKNDNQTTIINELEVLINEIESKISSGA